LQTPRDCLFHRGHAWARREADGTVTVGLDELAERVLGEVDAMLLPAVGTKLEVNGVAWTARIGRDEVRILAPAGGEVIAQGGRDRGWYLRMRPVAAETSTRHLLAGNEARAWMGHELARLVAAMHGPEVGAALADGGHLVGDLRRATPGADWDALRGLVLLNP
jgi:glycine cleavage system H lipoate-binding protein